MSQEPHDTRSLDDAGDRLESAEDSDDATRLELLEELHESLERELDADEAAAAGR